VQRRCKGSPHHEDDDNRVMFLCNKNCKGSPHHEDDYNWLLKVALPYSPRRQRNTIRPIPLQQTLWQTKSSSKRRNHHKTFFKAIKGHNLSHSFATDTVAKEVLINVSSSRRQDIPLQRHRCKGNPHHEIPLPFATLPVAKEVTCNNSKTKFVPLSTTNRIP